jgi:energy-converting hydrogenase A subunit M
VLTAYTYDEDVVTAVATAVGADVDRYVNKFNKLATISTDEGSGSSGSSSGSTSGSTRRRPSPR